MIEQLPIDPQKKLSVRQSTFSISEEFLRRVYRIRKKLNAEFILMIDRKALQKTRSLWRFVSQVYDRVYLSDTHAKVLLIDYADNAGDDLQCSLVTSQNLTRGNRQESSLITTDCEIFKSLSDDFNKIIKYRSVPMHEILPVPEAPEVNYQIKSSMNDTEETAPVDPQTQMAKNIENLASIFMPVSDIAVIVEMDANLLREALADPDHPFSLAYRRGKATAKAKIRAQEMELAQLGSPLGVQNVRDNLIDMEADE